MNSCKKSPIKKAIKILLTLTLLTANFSTNTKTVEWDTTGWSISKELFNHIRKILPEGSTMLELGSGWASGELSKFYTLYSVEHEEIWLDQYETNYIYAPIKNRWYDPEILAKSLPLDYDLILIDGPPGPIGRYGFFTYLHLFKTDLIIIFDDINRKAEYKLMVDVAKKLGKNFRIYKDSFGKKYGIVDNR